MGNIHTTNTITYNVVGRYMNGSNVTGYHLLGSNGNQLPVTKERLIFLIGRGIIDNMRIQVNGTEMIIRGKGVNLNNLPVYDEKRSSFRTNSESQRTANSAVTPKKDINVSLMGQLEIKKRIMYRTNCLGYMVVDHSGKERKLSRESVIQLALQKLISNATVQKYSPSPDVEKLILRGAGCDLASLPALIVDASGKIIDPESDRKDIKIRAIRMKRGGILYDKVKNKKYVFEAGDYLVCGIKAVLRPVKSNDMEVMFHTDRSTSEAICDTCLDNLNNYPIELFGLKSMTLSKKSILSWTIGYMCK